MNKRGFQDRLDKDFAGSVLRILLASIKSSESHQVHASSRLHEQPRAFNPKWVRRKWVACILAPELGSSTHLCSNRRR